MLSVLTNRPIQDLVLLVGRHALRKVRAILPGGGLLEIIHIGLLEQLGGLLNEKHLSMKCLVSVLLWVGHVILDLARNRPPHLVHQP